MKKILSVTLALLMLIGFGAVAFAEDEIVEEEAIVIEEATAIEIQADEELPAIEAQSNISDATKKITDARNQLSSEKRTALDKKFREKYEISLLSWGTTYQFFEFYSFWLTVYIPYAAWQDADASFFQIIWQFIRFLVSFGLRYFAFGFLWMPPF